ncbi:MAG: sulfotransferase [Pseudomonadota bacterium]
MASDRTLQAEIDGILALIRARDIRRAGPACESLVARYPQHAPAWATFAELWSAVNQPLRAIDCLEKAVEAAPESLHHQANLARFEAQVGRRRPAQIRAESLLEKRPEDYLLLDTLGNVFSQVGEQATALDLFERALALQPDSPTALYNLATSYRFFGRVDQAEALLERVLEIDPEDNEARHSLSVLRRQTSEHNHIDELQRRLNNRPEGLAACRYAYALGKEREDLGEPELAFEAYARGASIMRRLSPPTIEAELAKIERVTAMLEATDWQESRAGDETEEPVFIMGLPRTGSTLIERLLAAHSQVFAAGELIQFPYAVRQWLQVGPMDQICQMVEQGAGSLDWQQLGRAYIESTRPRTGHLPRFIDKLPVNEVWAGLIHRALPNARFVLTARDPMDTGFALFKTLFLNGHGWTYSLEDIGRYLKARQSMIAALKQVIPSDRLMEVAYEDLVTDPESAVRSLLTLLDLDFEPACLSSGNTDEAVVTASSHQVREAIYTSSVGKWRSLADQLTPLADALGLDPSQSSAGYTSA